MAGEVYNRTYRARIGEDERNSRSDAFTWRAFLLGALLCLLIGVAAPYNNMVLRGSYIALDFNMVAAFFLLCVVAGFLNAGLRWMNPRWAFSRAELILLFAMMAVANAIPTMGLTGYFIPILVAPFYYASPENQWAELIHPYVAPWMVPQRPEAIKWFYEGLPEGGAIPWGAWIVPLLHWGVFLVALYTVMICMMVIVRRQWIERERLIFPISQVAVEMVEGGNDSSPFAPFFRNPLMWIGFAIPFFIGSLRALHHYYPSIVPDIHLSRSIPIFRHTGRLTIALSFPMVGFSYLIGLHMAFSIWFFNVSSTVIRGVFTVLGLGGTGDLAPYDIQSPFLAHQGMGAMMVLVLAGLWVGREHFKRVVRKAFGKGADVDDSDEILSYRGAFWGMIGGGVVMGLWINRGGLAGWSIPLFLFCAFVVFLGITRIVAESGLVVARAPMIAPSFLVSGFGSSAIGASGLTVLSYTWIWAADVRTFVMASCIHGLKVIEETGRKRRRLLFWAMMAAVVLVLVGSVWMTLWVSYTYGKINIGGMSSGQEPFRYLARRMDRPTPVYWTGWLYTGIGAMLMSLLILAQRRFLWWPFHPIALPVSGVMMVDYAWFSIFLAWCLKAILLKYGGARVYLRSRLFFLGLILGQFVVNGTWIVVDALTGMEGNNIFWV